MADSLSGPVLYADGAMPNAVRTLLTEPRVPDPPRRVGRDWALIAIIIPVAVFEALVRNDLPWPPIQILFTVALSFTLLWRRTYPFAMVAIAFGAAWVHEITFYIAAEPSDGLYAGAFMLLLPYSLVRWGAGRVVVPGLLMMISIAVLSVFTGSSDIGEAVAGIVFLLFPAELGAAIRYQASSRLRRADQIRLREREQLARELHDTVAHHVSAIAIQAQAGRTVAATDPDAAVRVLDAIEKEASRSLAEMRAMVGILRSDEQADLAPQPGVADIESLARDAGDVPRINVALSGDLNGLSPSVGAAIYRLVQESITNARRHARHATDVGVEVVGDAHQVRLTVRDNGESKPFGGEFGDGYGLEGMAERTRLLGGTFQAGPDTDHGWSIDAVLPKSGVAE